MTVNTNGNIKIIDSNGTRTDGNHLDWTIERSHDQIDTIEKMVEEVRDSQLRTEKLVTEFVESMGKNPMFATMAKMFSR